MTMAGRAALHRGLPAPCTAALVIALGGQAFAQPVPCTEADRAALAEAGARLQALDDRAASDRLARDPGARPCRELSLARLAVAGWVEARALAAVGGDTAQLGPVNDVLRSLERLGSEPGTPFDERLETTYAVAAIRAAVAAAQDERPEMEVFLAHARDVARSLSGARASALWPLGIDDLEGELWLEVDWFDRARAAFERAGATSRGARPIVGLARTLRRLGDGSACATFAHAASMDLGPEARREVDAYLASCRP
jgi:hypothetical protein